MLRVRKDRIVDDDGTEARLRGVGIGGYLHLENFINGYPGTGHELQEVMANEDFFRRMLDHFFTEDDVAFIAQSGANTIRLPLNYRWFDGDEGFARVDRVVEWCERHDLYVILDAHAVAGWQNTDWSSDNASGRALFWKEPHFQDRYVWWWERLAERYRDREIVAGYDLLNEPVANAPPSGGFDKTRYQPGWGAINQLYRRTVAAIRAIDPHHIIFIEGDGYSERFAGLDAPFAENLVYSCHRYSAAGFGPGPYPSERWSAKQERDDFLATEGVRYALTHEVPLWVGEFGAVYNGPEHERDDRLRALEDQLALFESEAIHWTLWTYKDCGVLGWVTLDPSSPYMKLTAPIRRAKLALDTDFWLHWLPDPPFRAARRKLATTVFELAGELGEIDMSPEANQTHVSLAISTYAGALLQPAYAALFAALSPSELDEVLSSFRLSACIPNEPLMSLIRKITS
jgi:hypothetical protein